MALEKEFPYGINRQMDDHAARAGFPHWSCVSPKSNDWWVRRDGRKVAVQFSGFTNYQVALASFDIKNPMEAV